MRSILILPLLLACGDKSEETVPTPGDSKDTSTVEDTADTGEPAADFCTASGLTTRAFDASGSAGGFDTVVPDFTWNIRDVDGNASEWTFSEEWSGCDSYMLINYYAESNYPVEVDNRREIIKWLESSPLNVHYFFFTYDQSVDSTLNGITETINTAIESLDEDLAAHWRGRIHYVTDSPWEADWVGGLNSDYYVSGEFVLWASAIDRFGASRETGYFCDPTNGWATCQPEFLSYEPIYFNFESDREEQIAAEGDVTILDVWVDEPASDPGWSGTRIYAEVEFPSATEMATFDTMGFDLDLRCADYPAGVHCPPWDYLVYAYLCDKDDPSTTDDESNTCSTEIGRWITTYWLPGRWVHDVSPFLALLQDGGTRRFAFYTQQYYDVSLNVRLSNQDKGYRPVAMEPIFTGGAFNDRYNWGVNHEITKGAWRTWSHTTDDTTYDIATVDEGSGFLTAQEDGSWHRFDWMPADGTVYYCHTAEGLSSEAEALSADFSCIEDDPKTKDVDESSCSGANHADLVTGCNEAAWISLVGEGSTLWGSWQEVWHEGKRPVSFTPPEGTAQVGLVAVVSGHGFGDTAANCAEFCDHQHEFTLNDATAHTKTHPEVGNTFGCADQVADGTVPNQSGTWVYGRAGWCPGMEVRPWVVDITDDVSIGTDNQISYLGLMDGAVWKPGSTGANVRMQSYLVYYE
jgi:hypothetical protein